MLDSSEHNETLMLLSGAHPIHVKFSESIGADKYPLSNFIRKEQGPVDKFRNLVTISSKLPTNYKQIITESCFYYPALRRRIGGYGARIINLNSSPLIYKIGKSLLKFPEKQLMDALFPCIDAHLLLGKYGIEIIRETDSDSPYRVVYPFVQNGLFESLHATTPNPSRKTISTFIAIDPIYKGLDILLEALSLVEHEIELNIVGKADVSQIIRKTGTPKNVKINVLGFVPSIVDLLANTSLFVNMGRGDTFPVATLEATLAGVPTIVSEETGTKEVCYGVDKMYVVKLDAEALACSINAFFDFQSKKVLSHSAQFKKISSSFSEDAMVKKFSDEFQSLISSL